MKYLIKYFSCCVLFVCIDSLLFASIEEKIIFTPQETVITLYQLMKDVDELFHNSDITYWALYGTLLGAVRHKGLIPWDNDLDIGFFEHDIEKLIKLEPVLDKLNYYLKQKVGRGKKRLVWIIGKKGSHNHLDIIACKYHENKIFVVDEYVNFCSPKREGLEHYFTDEEFFPIKRCAFGAIQICCPANPIPFLHYAYGINCLTHAAPHAIPAIPGTILLEKEDLHPAYPLGPLFDNVSALNFLN